MIEIYVVTRGSYSDYGIVAVFSTKEKAMEFVDSKTELVEAFGYGRKKRIFHGFDEYHIEVYPLDDPDNEEYRSDIEKWYHVEMDKDGNGTAFEIHGYENRIDNKTNQLIGMVIALNEQHALKIANEIRSMLIYENEWR